MSGNFSKRPQVDILTLCSSQRNGNHAFGPELRATIGLFERKSVLAKKGSGLPELLRLLAHDVSVQAILPWNMIPLLLDVLGPVGVGGPEGVGGPVGVGVGSAARSGSESDINSNHHHDDARGEVDIFLCELEGIQERLTPEAKQTLSSIIGQPMVVKLLSSVVSYIPLLPQHPDLVLDCRAALGLIHYLVDCVKFSVPFDSRNRILEAARLDPMRPAEPHRCPNADAHGPYSRCELCSYSRDDFRIHGKHSPVHPVTQPRGRFPKDKLADKEKEEQQHGCDKDFEKGKNGNKTSGGLMAL